MTAEGFVCPFCPLHCDDLDASTLAVLVSPGGGMGATSAAAGLTRIPCPLLARRLAPAIAQDATAQAAGEAAIGMARGWVAGAQSILITGQVTDLETARAVCRFAELTGASVTAGEDPETQSGDTAAYRETFSREGIFGITLGDAASQRSSVILIGDPSPHWPRLRERLARAGEILVWERTDRLAERLAGLRRVIRRSSAGPPADDLDVAKSGELCGRAVSVVFVVAPGSVGAAECRPFWSTMIGLLGDLNQRRRAALLRFDDCLTLRSVTAWSRDSQAKSRVGDPQATADVVIQLRPWPFDGADAIGTADAGHTAALRHGLNRGAVSGKRVTIGWASDASMRKAIEPADCHLPASLAGIGRRGVVLRGDGSVALPLRPLTATELPSPAEVLAQLLG